MTDFEKGKAWEAMERIKKMPPWMQDIQLVLMCKMEKSGSFENAARILASHGVPTNEIMPCIMELLQEVLTSEVGKDEDRHASGSD